MTPSPRDDLRKALEAACQRLQSFLDTFGDVGDSVTQADINDWIGLTTPPADTPSVEREGWRYEIQHGPDGETDYAWVYDDKNNMVCTAKAHHAMAIVAGHGGVTLDVSDVHYLGVIKLRLERLYEENPNDCRLREQISDEVSWIDGLTDKLTSPDYSPPAAKVDAGNRRAQLRALLHGINAKIGIRDPNWWDVAAEIVNDELATIPHPLVSVDAVSILRTIAGNDGNADQTTAIRALQLIADATAIITLLRSESAE